MIGKGLIANDKAGYTHAEKMRTRFCAFQEGVCNRAVHLPLRVSLASPDQVKDPHLNIHVDLSSPMESSCEDRTLIELRCVPSMSASM
ncbi:hypothetical protein C0J52_18023 [Blattella germanica]|nr:hypothetical protein C0J52_18023 [Blattella germanica]